MSDVLLYFFINMWTCPNFTLFWHVLAFNHSSSSVLSNRSASKSGNLVLCPHSSYNFIIYTSDWNVVNNRKDILPELKVVEPESELGGSVLSNGVPRELVPLPCSPLVDISTLDQLDHVGKLGFSNLYFVNDSQNNVQMWWFTSAALLDKLLLQFSSWGNGSTLNQWFSCCCWTQTCSLFPQNHSTRSDLSPDSSSQWQRLFFVFFCINAKVLASCLLFNNNDPVLFSWYERDRASRPWLLSAFYFPFQDLHSRSGKDYSKIIR